MMTVAVSACLLGENCKYNGGNNYSARAAEFVKGHEVIPICPERLAGMPAPRPNSEIVNGEIMNRAGRSVDADYRRGAQMALEIARREQPDLVILQSRSPTCGVNQIYDGTFSGKLVPGNGITAQKLLDAGIAVYHEKQIDSIR